jgi:phage antirepressor YoqD-like protein
MPYRKYIDLGYFRVIESKYIDCFGEVKISSKTVVYQKGINFILKSIKEKKGEKK